MSHIDELIQQHCPSGVDFRHLSDLAVTVPGLTGKTKADFSDGNARFASYRNIFANPSLDLEAPDFVKVKEGERQNAVQLGDILITGSSESLDEVGMSSVVTSEPSEPIYINSFCFIVRLSQRDLLDPGFAKHLFRSESIRKQIRGTASGVTRINISKPRFMKIRIPVPPLEVQLEIVRVLDQFTQLEAELEAELEARRRQYEHYRTELLGDDHDGHSLPLGDIFDMRAGMHLKASEISGTESETHPYRCFGGNGIRGFVSSFNYNEDVVLIGRQGALCGNVHRAQGKIYATEHAVVVTPKVEVDMAWAFHKLTEMDLNQYKTESAQPGLAVGRIKEIVISVPSLEAQRRISAILDKFDALVNGLNIGLPAELAARRRQYEYYRDRLLTFKELAS